jgi:hypothetical protein
MRGGPERVAARRWRVRMERCSCRAKSDSLMKPSRTDGAGAEPERSPTGLSSLYKLSGQSPQSLIDDNPDLHRSCGKDLRAVRPVEMGKSEACWRHSGDTESYGDTRLHGRCAGMCLNTGDYLAAPQGFEPRYADPELMDHIKENPEFHAENSITCL